MSRTCTCTNVQVIEGRVYVDFDDSTQLEWNSIEEMAAACGAFARENDAVEHMRRFLLGTAFPAVAGGQLPTAAQLAATLKNKRLVFNRGTPNALMRVI